MGLRKDFKIQDIIDERLDDEIDKLKEMVKDIEDEYGVDIWINVVWDYKV